MDGELDFPADLERQAGEHVERVDDPAVGAVLDRDDAVVGVAAVHFFKDRSDRVDRDEVGTLPKPFDGRQMRKAERRAQVSNPDHLDLVPGGANHLAETGSEDRDRDGPVLVELIEPVPQLLVHVRIEPDLVAVLEVFELGERQFHPAVEQPDELLIHRLDFIFRRGRRLLADHLDRGGRWPKRVWPRSWCGAGNPSWAPGSSSPWEEIRIVLTELGGQHPGPAPSRSAPLTAAQPVDQVPDCNSGGC